MASDIAMSKLLSFSGALYSLISLAVGFLVVGLGGYSTARMRPRGALMLAVIAAAMGIVSLAITRDRAPIWRQTALVPLDRSHRCRGHLDGELKACHQGR